MALRKKHPPEDRQLGVLDGLAMMKNSNVPHGLVGSISEGTNTILHSANPQSPLRRQVFSEAAKRIAGVASCWRLEGWKLEPLKLA